MEDLRVPMIPREKPPGVPTSDAPSMVAKSTKRDQAERMTPITKYVKKIYTISPATAEESCAIPAGVTKEELDKPSIRQPGATNFV